MPEPDHPGSHVTTIRSPIVPTIESLATLLEFKTCVDGHSFWQIVSLVSSLGTRDARPTEQSLVIAHFTVGIDDSLIWQSVSGEKEEEEEAEALLFLVVLHLEYVLILKYWYSSLDLLRPVLSRLNEIQTPGWSSLNYYDKLHRCLASVVYCVTEREAANLSIFLQETLRLLERWTNSKIYTKFVDLSKFGYTSSILAVILVRIVFISAFPLLLSFL